MNNANYSFKSLSEKFTTSSWATQFIRFGLVGATATIMHVTLYVSLIEFLTVEPVLSNVIAFMSSVAISFVGHAQWTFRNEFKTRSKSAHIMLLQFISGAVLGLILNTAFVAILVTTLGLSYAWAIPCFVVITPFILYVINKIWVFT